MTVSNSIRFSVKAFQELLDAVKVPIRRILSLALKDYHTSCISNIILTDYIYLIIGASHRMKFVKKKCHCYIISQLDLNSL